MPFAGRSDGEVVSPEEVDDGTEVECPRCGDELKPRSSHYRDGDFVARHFYHSSQTRGCSGESEEHLRMKSIALSKLKDTFPNHVSAGTEREIGGRRADVFVEFEENDPRLGNGVIVEVQWRNEGKEIDVVTNAYLEAGWSVFWVRDGDFKGKDVSLVDPTMVFPTVVPPEEQWTGVRDYEFEYSSPTMNITFPEEILNSNEDWLNDVWSFWSSGEWNMRHELTANNADRRCTICSDDARYYVSGPSFSGFVCSDHSDPLETT